MHIETLLNVSVLQLTVQVRLTAQVALVKVCLLQAAELYSADIGIVEISFVWQ